MFHCIYAPHLVFIHSSIDGHLGCFHGFVFCFFWFSAEQLVLWSFGEVIPWYLRICPFSHSTRIYLVTYVPGTGLGAGDPQWSWHRPSPQIVGGSGKCWQVNRRWQWVVMSCDSKRETSGGRVTANVTEQDPRGLPGTDTPCPPPASCL